MRQLGIFAKYPQPGRVKTRLAASIGDEPACRLYRAFVETLLARFSDVADRRILAFSPPERRAEFEALAGRCWQLAEQSAGDLGQRMQRYFKDAFERGASRVVLLGSDSPTLPVEYVEQAFELLNKISVVLGPSDDGGYYLIGAAERVPPIFDDIAWSSEAVWEQTTNRLRSLGQDFRELPPWYDVDDEKDLRRLRDELSDEPSSQGYTDREFALLRDSMAHIDAI